MIKKSLLFFMLFSCVLHAQDLFTALHPIFKLYHRPMTILAIGKQNIPLNMRDQEHTLVIATNTLSTSSSSSPFIHLKKTLNLSDLKDLNRLEHFDLVIATYPFQDATNWKEMIDELFKLGDHLVILTSSQEKAKRNQEEIAFKMTHYLINLGLKTPLAWEEDSLLWYCFKPPAVNPKIYRKNIRKQGISLFTFQKYLGAFPLKTSLEEKRGQLPFWIRPFTRFIRIKTLPKQKAHPPSGSVAKNIIR